MAIYCTCKTWTARMDGSPWGPSYWRNDFPEACRKVVIVNIGLPFSLDDVKYCPYCGAEIKSIEPKGSVVDTWDDDWGLSAGAEQDYECRYDCALRPAA